MKILHVIDSVNPAHGGPIEGVKQRARVLVSWGHEVTIACSDEPTDKWVREFEYPIYPLGPAKCSFRYASRLRPWLSNNFARFDAVVVNGIWQYHGLAVRQALRRKTVPYFVFPHGMLDPWFKKSFPLKHLKKCAYWRLGEYRVLRDAHEVLFTCEEERILAAQSFRPYRVRERVVNYGSGGPPESDPERANSFLEAYPELEGMRIVLFLSRIHPKKGCDIAIKAFASNAESQPNLRLVMAGPDQVGIVDELRELAHSDGVSERIVWPGMLTGDLKWDAMRAADLFLLPSHQENFGIVVAEALACGTPVLISNKVNIWREVQAAEAGLVSHDTVEATTDMLQRWLAMQEAERRAFRQRARTLFLDRFEITKSAESLVDAIERARTNR
jgi:glycosyltransferase involved in cell wall biosynthesis